MLQIKIESMIETPLSDRPIKFEGQIKSLSGDEEVSGRLIELGFTRGELVRVVGRAPFGDPIMVEIRGAVLALRKSEAECIKT